MLGSKTVEPVIALLDKSLGLRSRRQEVIAGNLANLDTPDYSRKELDFEATLAGYLQTRGAGRLAQTDPRHLGSAAALGQTVSDTDEDVDIDREMVRLTQNTLQYQATVQMLIRKLDSLKTALDGGGR